MTSLAIDYWMAGGLENLFPYHFSSFLFYVLTGLLLFFLLKKLFIGSSKCFSLGLLAVYFVHPVHAETVNYIIQRGDILAALLTLFPLLLYIYFPNLRKYYLYLIPFFIGIIAKTNAVVFVPIFFAYIYLFEEEKGAKDLLDVHTFFKSFIKSIPALIVFCIGFFLVSIMQAGHFQPGGHSAFNYIISQPYMLMYYNSALFAPFHLNADTDWQPFTSVFEPKVLFGFLYLYLVLSAIIISSNYKRTKPIAFGLLWFLVGHLPTSLIPFAEVMNDHRMFLSQIGLFIAFGWMFFLVFEQFVPLVKNNPTLRFFSLALYFCLLACLGYGTYERNKVWKNEESLWLDCTEKSPKNGRALMNYGLALMGKRDYKNAEIYFQRGLVQWPYYAYLHVNMGILKNAIGNPTEAESYFKSGIQYGQAYPNSYFYYARFLSTLNRKEESTVQLQKCLSMSEAHMEARNLLMNDLYTLGRYEELKLVASKTLAILPESSTAKQFLAMANYGKSSLEITKEQVSNSNNPNDFLNLSLQYYQAEQYEKCIEAARKALNLKPDFPQAYNNIGSAHIMLKQYDTALLALNKALSLDPTNQLAKNNIAWAESEKKKAIIK
jgi:tetratricopeptide (TPR) repeat protein